MQRISFTPAMLQAVLSGVKTVTRRRLLPELPMQQEPGRYQCLSVTAQGAIFEDLHTTPPLPLVALPCPLGKAGDVLSVQENPALRLQLVSVRAERVQQLTEADAVVEGIGRREVEGMWQWGGVEPNLVELGHFCWYSTPIEAFQGLLNSIYPTAWARNEWVWVVEFVLLPPK